METALASSSTPTLNVVDRAHRTATVSIDWSNSIGHDFILTNLWIAFMFICVYRFFVNISSTGVYLLVDIDSNLLVPLYMRPSSPEASNLWPSTHMIKLSPSIT
ncbi:hypothetical protein DICVIV_12656 [Dictyocaulus viviparus]|uniref:Uncharacterized protein n=1 Tax=Dictyocaulus viviparus TaxID=29172 RepID=A0A0D8XCJ1_DICVI|nr:hypothetical protein DICVIV_12656 [Dictyocaulus viviparus]